MQPQLGENNEVLREDSSRNRRYSKVLNIHLYQGVKYTSKRKNIKDKNCPVSEQRTVRELVEEEGCHLGREERIRFGWGREKDKE